MRAHEVKDQGYDCHMLDDDLKPQCITVFSAPNYVGFYGNRGAVLCVAPGHDRTEFITYAERTDQPLVLQFPYADEQGRGRILERADLFKFHMADLVAFVTKAVGALLDSTQSQDDDTDDPQYRALVQVVSRRKASLRQFA